MGGGTNSYREVEDTDVILLWGSNARDAHPVWFQHLLKGLHKGARLYVMDPRRTASAQWADVWLGLDVGTDIALANAMAREIIAAGLHHPEFIANATEGFEAYRTAVDGYTLTEAERTTGVPAEVIREAAHTYARASKAMIFWTLGIAQHHNAVDCVLALINLALLTGHVGKWASGCNPLRGQNNVQGGGEMGALPHRLPGFHDILNPDSRRLFEALWQVPIIPHYGWNLTQMLLAMERRELRALYIVGENPAHSDANAGHVEELLRGLDHLVVQEVFLTRTAEFADVVLPAAATWCESEGTMTNSERRVQRVRKALDPPPDARDDLWILAEVARRMGVAWEHPTAESIWNEFRSIAPIFAGLSYARLDALNGIQWPCPDESHPGTAFLHARLWEEPRGGRAAPFSVVHHDGPVEPPDAEYPFLLTTGRRLEVYNTGVQTASYNPPLRRSEAIDLAPEDAQRLGIVSGALVEVVSRRGRVTARAGIDGGLRPGLVFMPVNFPDVTNTNALTIDAFDPKSGTSEFKACAVRIAAVSR